jgi:hypothetical protein
MEKARKLFIARLEKNIQKQISVAREKSNTALIAKLEVLLSVVQERLNSATDDEALINSLFQE